VGTAVGGDARRLVGEPFGWIDYLGFQSNLLIHMVTVLDFDGLPGFLSHDIPLLWRLNNKYSITRPGRLARKYGFKDICIIKDLTCFEYKPLSRRGKVSGVIFG
jgi:hypothetical protein